MLTAERIKERLESIAQSKIKTYPVEHLSASRIGHPCERYLYLLIKNWQDVKLHDTGLQHIFDLGNSIEDYAIERLKEAGFEVVTPTVRSWKIEKPLITGREDLRIKDEETGEFLPVEVKSISPYEFDNLNSEQDFLTSKKAYIRAYPSQLFVYMYRFNKERGFFVLVNKLTGEIKPILVNFNYELGEACLQKAERIYKALEVGVAPDSCEDVDVCERCNLQHICGQVKRVPADIEVDGELEELVNKRFELAPAKKEYERLDSEIKKKIGEREKVITGGYLIERKGSVRKGYTVQDSVVYKISYKKL